MIEMIQNPLKYLFMKTSSIYDRTRLFATPFSLIFPKDIPKIFMLLLFLVYLYRHDTTCLYYVQSIILFEILFDSVSPYWQMLYSTFYHWYYKLKYIMNTIHPNSFRNILESEIVKVSFIHQITLFLKRRLFYGAISSQELHYSLPTTKNEYFQIVSLRCFR